MQAFTLAELAEAQARAGGLYHEFLRVPALSMGLYVLPAGATDPQQPHQEDEVYYVVAGRAQFRAGDEERAVGPGDTLYVPARVPHRFHTIETELRLLVVFAPAPTRPAPSAG